ncbi:hypothetical protein MLD38_029587 [Melastoma candidum]|uniref:Uncharacterized protein n=1 Tax=Melastoma candidum TaxID=119954 RepID=A0ACB9N6A2_9MYRT|nr:hypothetical protein MLD38_029587 [Melastoma candidum]
MFPDNVTVLVLGYAGVASSGIEPKQLGLEGLCDLAPPGCFLIHFTMSSPVRTWLAASLSAAFSGSRSAYTRATVKFLASSFPMLLASFLKVLSSRAASEKSVD